MNGVVRSGAVGAVAGFLTRPCCVGPAALSLAGVSSAGLAHALITYRSAFLSLSVAMLAGSIWINFRREGGWFNRILASVAALVTFFVSIQFLGML